MPASTSADGRVSAADRRVARQLFQEGVALAEQGDLAGAIEKFRASYDRNPRSFVLFNIGVLQRELGDKLGALETFRQYLEVWGTEVDAAQRERVEAFVHDLERELTFIEITANEDGATVLIDGRPVGTTPLAAPVSVAPGIVEIRVQKAGFEDATTMVTVAAAQTTQVAVALVPVSDTDGGGPARVEDQGQVEEASEDDIVWWKQWWFWTAVGAVVVGASVTTGVLLAPDDVTADPPATWSVYGR